ncbi:CaiB/BaiF CoA transferase family protein [Streptomyces sp. NPDC004779]
MTNETTAGTGPLSGLRVVELAGIGPAPFACMMLADLGADVIRVDRAGERSYAGWHQALDRGRRSVILDLKSADGREALLRLVDRSDVLVEGFRPGVTERLGVGPEVCRARNPGLVYARMTGWGQHGPLAAQPGHDINYIALTGALDAIGPAGGPPVPPLNLLGDFAGGGMFLFAGILAAIVERHGSGLGQEVDAAIVDGTTTLLGMLTSMTGTGAWVPGRGVNLLDGGAPYYGVYACADGLHIAVGALEEPFYRALLDGLGLGPGPSGSPPPDRSDPGNWPLLRRLFAQRFASAPRGHWEAVFAGTDACVTPVLTLAEAREHPHQRAREAFVATPAGPQPAAAPRFARTPGAPGAAAPRPGEHTRTVLAECGLPERDIERLLASGAAWAA